MKAIEVFNLVAQKRVESAVLGVIASEDKNLEVFAISDKQYNWLVSVISKEFKNWDCNMPIVFSDDTFNYNLNPSKKTANVPYYIPNQKQYGSTHYITKRKK